MTKDINEKGKSIIERLNERIEQGSTVDFFVLGALSLALNYANQTLSWNFENHSSAFISFFFFSILLLALIFIVIQWIVGLFKKKLIFLLTFKYSRDFLEKNIFRFNFLFSVIFPLFLFILLGFCLFFSISNFTNYNKLRNKVLTEKNRIETYKSSTFFPKDEQWVIVNQLISDNIDDETLVFATNLSNGLQKEINQRKLPIKIIDNINKINVDSFANIYTGIYIIKGTYYNNEAEIYIENFYKRDSIKNQLGQLYEKLGIKNHDNSQLDSIFEAYMSKKTLTALKKDILYDKDNSVIDRYNLKIGIPNEIRYFIYSTISDFILKSSRKFSLKNNADTLQQMLKYGIAVSELAKFSIPYEVNYWGLSPKIRKSVNVNNLYNNLANFYILKAMVILQDKELSHFLLKTSIAELSKASYYLAKLSSNIDDSSYNMYKETVISHLLYYEYTLALISIKGKELKLTLEKLKVSFKSIKDRFLKYEKISIDNIRTIDLKSTLEYVESSKEIFSQCIEINSTLIKMNREADENFRQLLEKIINQSMAFYSTLIVIKLIRYH